MVPVSIYQASMQRGQEQSPVRNAGTEVIHIPEGCRVPPGPRILLPPASVVPVLPTGTQHRGTLPLGRDSDCDRVGAWKDAAELDGGSSTGREVFRSVWGV